MRNTLIAGLAMLALTACTTAQVSTNLAKPISVAAVTNAQTALMAYQAALGLAEVALRNNPALSAKVAALIAKAQPAVDAATQGVTDASTAPTLGALAAQLLIEGAAFIRVVPNGAAAH